MRIQTNKNEVLFLTSVMLFWFAQYVYIPHQVNFLESQLVSGSLIGLVIAGYGISQMALRIPIGFLADFYSITKPFIMVGSLGAGLASIIRLSAPNGVGFLIANLFSGLASATWISFMVFYLMGASEKETINKTSNIIMAMNLGMLTAFMFSSNLYKSVGMQGMAIAGIIAGILSCILLLAVKEFATPIHKGETTSKSCSYILSILFNKKLLFFSFIALVQQGIQMTTTMSYSNQIIKSIGANDVLVGLSSVIYMSSSVFFSWLAKHRVLSNVNRNKSMVFSLVCLVVYLLLYSQVQSVPLALVLQILPGITTGLCFTYLNSEAMSEVDDQRKSTAMGIFQAIYAIGMSLFPIIASAIANHSNIRISYLYLAAFVIVSILLLLWYNSKDDQKLLPQE